MEISIGNYKVRVIILVAIFFVFWVMFGHMLVGCCRLSFPEAMTLLKRSKNIAMTTMANAAKEGFTIAPEFSEAQSAGYIMNPTMWGSPSASSYTPPVGGSPMPNNGEMDMLANTSFKPECCPNTYSSSSGCACMTVKQQQYLNSRGNNNVPYSQW